MQSTQREFGSVSSSSENASLNARQVMQYRKCNVWYTKRNLYIQVCIWDAFSLQVRGAPLDIQVEVGKF